MAEDKELWFWVHTQDLMLFYNQQKIPFLTANELRNWLWLQAWHKRDRLQLNSDATFEKIISLASDHL